MSSTNRKRLIAFTSLALLCFLITRSGIPAADKTGSDTVTSAAPQIQSLLGQLPLSFEPNLGQFDPQVKFLAHTSAGILFLTQSEAVLAIGGASSPGLERRISLTNPSLPTAPKPPAHPTTLRYQLIGANSVPGIAGADELPGKSNYFIGSNPQKWHTDVPTYARVSYKSVYPGIDLAWYGSQSGLEYDFTVAPGAAASIIRMRIAGASSIALKGGDLVLRTAAGELKQRQPLIYQDDAAGRHPVTGGYRLLADGTLGFTVAAYDTNRPLVIDPFLDYSTYFYWSTPTSVAVDADHNMYVAGDTLSSNFPTLDPLQAQSGGGDDGFVSKLNPTGSALLYSTYLGGSYDDRATSIAVDSAGNAYLTGNTYSSDFPTHNPIPMHLSPTLHAFVTKLSPQGNALSYSTFLGGNGYDRGWGIAVDSAGEAYISGDTSSTDFPTRNPLQPNFLGLSDGFVTKLNAAGSDFIFSTYLGGQGGTLAWGIALDQGGNAYVTGSTDASDFPTVNAIQPHCTPFPYTEWCNSLAFIAKIDSHGAYFYYSTFFGGTTGNDGYGIGVDSAGEAVVFGDTDSTDFPTRNPAQPRLSGTYDTFVAKLNAAGSALVYSTYLGGSQMEWNGGLAVASSGEAYVTGLTASLDFPVHNPFSPGPRGLVGTAYVTKLNADGSFNYSGYLGGTAGQTGKGIAVDEQDRAYVVGITNSTDFPLINPLSSDSSGLSFIARVNGSLYTPTPTPTLAPFEFYDVPPGSIWYDYVHWLASRGIVSGVSPGYYLPNANTTRAQFAKMITLGFGYPLITPSAGQSFTDVPPSYFAYTFIETAHAEGVISGYSVPQCQAEGRAYPCFGPNDFITRAQLVLIAVRATGWALVTPSSPTFSDVPQAAFAYAQIETAVSKGVISGFSDSPSYHPCADAGISSPCFLPGSHGTRGQLAKILYNTLNAAADTATPTSIATVTATSTPLPSTAIVTSTNTPLSPSFTPSSPRPIMQLAVITDQPHYAGLVSVWFITVRLLVIVT